MSILSHREYTKEHHTVRYDEATDTTDEVCFLMHTACQISPKLFHTEF